MRAVSMGRRNTKLEVYLARVQRLKSFGALNQTENYPG
jgi:hypothetical protein